MPKLIQNGITYTGFSASGHNYSTSEQPVGTWTDGSVIYEKTCTYPNITQTPSNWVDLETFSNISQMISIEGFMDISNGQRNGNQYYVRFVFQNNILKFYGKELSAGLGNITVTIRYTKTSS
ncbi:MAG: hypothetical protein IKH20_11865 [Clostridiales bacterium]|nr:hypothetical protein [Clostridiales bacterium]